MAGSPPAKSSCTGLLARSCLPGAQVTRHGSSKSSSASASSSSPPIDDEADMVDGVDVSRSESANSGGLAGVKYVVIVDIFDSSTCFFVCFFFTTAREQSQSLSRRFTSDSRGSTIPFSPCRGQSHESGVRGGRSGTEATRSRSPQPHGARSRRVRKRKREFRLAAARGALESASLAKRSGKSDAPVDEDDVEEEHAPREQDAGQLSHGTRATVNKHGGTSATRGVRSEVKRRPSGTLALNIQPGGHTTARSTGRDANCRAPHSSLFFPGGP